VPATSGSLKTAVAGASSGQTFVAAAGDHAFASGIGYANSVRINYTVDGVTIYGPDAILKPQAIANGISILGDNCVVRGEPGHPIVVTASSSAGGPATPDGSGLININGNPANNPDSDGAEVRNTLIQDFALNGVSLMDTSQQMLYVNGAAIGLTLRRGVFNANGSQGFGLHQYHAGAVPSDLFVFEDLDFHGFGAAGKSPIVLWNPVLSVVFRRCRFFSTTALWDARLGTGGPVRFESCEFVKPIKNEGSTIIDGGGNTGYSVV
jgi:hypothetical protein